MLVLGVSGAALLGGCGSATKTVSVAGTPPASQTTGATAHDEHDHHDRDAAEHDAGADGTRRRHAGADEHPHRARAGVRPAGSRRRKG